jgi:hypothetical protein
MPSRSNLNIAKKPWRSRSDEQCGAGWPHQPGRKGRQSLPAQRVSDEKVRVSKIRKPYSKGTPKLAEISVLRIAFEFGDDASKSIPRTLADVAHPVQEHVRGTINALIQRSVCRFLAVRRTVCAVHLWEPLIARLICPARRAYALQDAPTAAWSTSAISDSMRACRTAAS